MRNCRRSRYHASSIVGGGSLMFWIVALLYYCSFGWLSLSWLDSSSPSAIVVVLAMPSSNEKEYYSGALKFHKKYYSTFPPHDSRLYDVLQLRPNATLADISRNYRRACLRYHPDKNPNNCNTNQNMWEEVQHAYDILKTEESRLLYHKYGLLQNTTCHSIAHFLKLSGSSNSVNVHNPNSNRQFRWTWQQLSLLELMGYDPQTFSNDSNRVLDNNYYRNQFSNILVEDRISYMAKHLVETIRPLVEGSVNQKLFVHTMATKMDQLKRAPLGAPMIRCIGRAYRYSGQRILQHHRHTTNKKRHSHFLSPKKTPSSFWTESQMELSKNVVLPLTFSVQNHWRGTKQLLTAAMASSKFIIQDHKLQQHQKKKLNKKKKSKKPPQLIKFPELGSLQNEEDDNIDDSIPWIEDEDYDDFLSIHEDDDNDESMKDDEEAVQSRALLKSLQIEALWSITKIEIDRIVQQACELILKGRHNFFQSSSSSSQGWVGSTGEIIDTHVGRLRAAAAMVLLGDIMVDCSKENTSWLE